MWIDDIQDASTSYHHFGSPQNLSNSDFVIKVTLRRVSSDGNCVETIEKHIQWQEKIVGPHEDFKNAKQSLDPDERWNSLDPRKRVGELSLNDDCHNRGRSFCNLVLFIRISDFAKTSHLIFIFILMVLFRQSM